MASRDDIVPFSEPLRTTLLRTGLIAAGVGLALSISAGGLHRWPMATLLAFVPSFGGHWFELWFLNWLRPRLPHSRPIHVAARLLLWFIAGIVLLWCMQCIATAMSGARPVRWPMPWIAGLGFIGIELVVHLVLQLRGLRNFYNGRG